MPSDDKFHDQVAALAVADARYAVAAYVFVREAVTYTAKHLQPESGGQRQHITGGQLLEGFRLLALERLGCLTMEVLEDWGLRHTEDVGAIVFSLVRNGLLGANENDSPSDFAGIYDFEKTFGSPFRAVSSGAGTGRERPPAIA